MYHCYSGKGKTIITPPQGEQVTVEWVAKDTFAVPSWSKIQHINEGGEVAHLFAVNDRPWLKNLGLLRVA
jgi:gentisate 1,2-dioxygenase